MGNKHSEEEGDGRVLSGRGAPDQPSLYQHDFLLDFVVFMIEQKVVSFGLTLLIDGQYVSGFPITRREFIDGMGSGFQNEPTLEPTTAATMQKFFSRIAASLEPETARPEDDEEPYTPSVAIHMKDVRIKLGETTITIPFWRGRTTAVSAWFPGTIGSGSR